MGGCVNRDEGIWLASRIDVCRYLIGFYEGIQLAIKINMSVGLGIRNGLFVDVNVQIGDIYQ